MGIQKLHPFDSEKYGKVYRHLRRKLKFKKADVYSPKMVSDNELLAIHTLDYLETLNKSETIAEISEMPPIRLLPISILRNRILKPMRYATGGTMLGIDIALLHGYAINLSGGYHHAKSSSGGGFSFYADINLAIDKLFKIDSTQNILVIDLDAHQGNGHESIAKDHPHIHILDVYNSGIYPFDYGAKQYIDFDYPISSHTEDSMYLDIIQTSVKKAIEDAHPNFIIYNAGTDIFIKDPLGDLDITCDGIVKRDEIVFEYAMNNKIPILMLLSGGYSKESSKIIGKSLENVLIKYK